MVMEQIFARSILTNLSLKGQAQDNFEIIPGKFITHLGLQMDVTYTSTTSTVNPHPADILNAIARMEVYTSGANTLFDLSGQDIYDLFVKKRGVAGDNKALVGATAATAATARIKVDIPFVLENGRNPWDGILETLQKKVFVKLTYNKLDADGTLFGTATGLSDVTANISVSTREYRASPEKAQELLKNTVQRIMRGADYPISQSNDAFVIGDLPENERYMGITIMPRVTSNNNSTPSSSLIDATKRLSVKSSQDNTIYQQELVRVLRSETLQARQDSSVAAGLLDIPLTADGAISQHILSTSVNKLSLEVPAVNTGTSPTIRVVTNTFRRTLEVNK